MFFKVSQLYRTVSACSKILCLLEPRSQSQQSRKKNNYTWQSTTPVDRRNIVNRNWNKQTSNKRQQSWRQQTTSTRKHLNWLYPSSERNIHKVRQPFKFRLDKTKPNHYEQTHPRKQAETSLALAQHHHFQLQAYTARKHGPTIGGMMTTPRA